MVVEQEENIVETFTLVEALQLANSRLATPHHIILTESQISEHNHYIKYGVDDDCSIYGCVVNSYDQFEYVTIINRSSEDISDDDDYWN